MMICKNDQFAVGYHREVFAWILAVKTRSRSIWMHSPHFAVQFPREFWTIFAQRNIKKSTILVVVHIADINAFIFYITWFKYIQSHRDKTRNQENTVDSFTSTHFDSHQHPEVKCCQVDAQCDLTLERITHSFSIPRPHEWRSPSCRRTGPPEHDRCECPHRGFLSSRQEKPKMNNIHST